MTAVNLISITPNAEQHIAYCARVSSPRQANPEYAKLLKYCIDHGHWSIYEMAFAVMEIQTSRAISAQILRHRSFSYQEFSTRYAEVVERPDVVVGRRQAEKNRQSSTEGLSDLGQDRWLALQDETYAACYSAYQSALAIGVAREQARMLLPLAAPSRLYMAGSIRSWIHYVNLRCAADTQLEHRQIAEGCRDLLAKELPTIAQALGWPPPPANDAPEAKS